MTEPIDFRQVTGLVLAGGQGSRMGGADKGLQEFGGQTLAQHALQRLAAQTGTVMISANRNLPDYGAYGVPVWPDDAGWGEYPGPLAGFLAGLTHCATPYLLTVPCDTPYFPVDLTTRLAQTLAVTGASLVLAATPGAQGKLHRQPAFCLMKTGLRESLLQFLQQGGHKVGAWADGQNTALAVFDRPQDDPLAFFNVNTLTELEQLRRAG